VRRGLLVTGGTGFLGRALLKRLLLREVLPITASFRSKEAFFPAEVNSEFVGELGSNTVWSSALKNVDVVVHCAAYAHVLKEEMDDQLTLYRKVNVEGTLSLASQALRAGVRRFVYISSIKVNGERTLPTQPFRDGDTPAPEGAYGISKFEAEQGLITLAKNSGMELVIIRPPLVYGPGVKGNFSSLISWVRHGIPLPLGAVQNKRSMIAIDNLVDFIAKCADPELTPRAANEVFLISDGEDVSTTELLRKVANAYEVSTCLLPVSVSVMQAVAQLLGKRLALDRLLGSLVVDSTKARELLGWSPVVSMDEQLRKMAQHDSGV
jgi:nucleoside-diphosphate-sugar epimerase